MLYLLAYILGNLIIPELFVKEVSSSVFEQLVYLPSGGVCVRKHLT